MFISKETSSSSYWSFCWTCLDLSCHYWVIRCWPHFSGWSYLACSACYCTRSSTVCTRWFQIYAKLSTRIKPKSSFKTRRRDLNWSGSKSFKLDCGPNTYNIFNFLWQCNIFNNKQRQKVWFLYLRWNVGKHTFS